MAWLSYLLSLKMHTHTQAINMHRMYGGVRVKADIRPYYNHVAHDHGAYKSMEHTTKNLNPEKNLLYSNRKPKL